MDPKFGGNKNQDRMAGRKVTVGVGAMPRTLRNQNCHVKMPPALC